MLLAFCGAAFAVDIPASVWSQTKVDMTKVQTFDLSEYMLSTAEGKKGFTLMVDFYGVTANDSESAFWIGTGETEDYKNSAATLVWSWNPKLANAANGSSNKGVVDLPENDADYVYEGTVAGNSSSNVTTTYFITSYEGTAYLYQKGATEGVVRMFGNDQMSAGDVKYLQISNWNRDATSQKSGTANFTLYEGVLSTEQMTQLVYPIPEPTTATLSLLALAGLAARRRRK